MNEDIKQLKETKKFFIGIFKKYVSDIIKKRETQLAKWFIITSLF